MSKAYKCDRCGKLYTHQSDPDTNNLKRLADYIGEMLNSVVISKYTLCLTRFKDGQLYQSYDLCPDCQRSLEIWLNTHDEKATTEEEKHEQS